MLWMFDHRDGFQPVPPGSHALESFPIGNWRCPLTEGMTAILAANGFEVAGQDVCISGGVLCVHRAASADSPHLYFGWSDCVGSDLRILFCDLPSLLEFVTRFRGVDAEIKFRTHAI